MPGTPSKLHGIQHNIRRPYNTMTLQSAPGVPASKGRPITGKVSDGYYWYNNLTYGKDVSQNPFFYGSYLGHTKKNEPIHRSIEEAFQADAIAGTVILTLLPFYLSTFHPFLI
jgi:hypothetical protein